MVNAPHHPAKGAFPQSADNLICNTVQREKKTREGERGGGKKEALEMWTRAGIHNAKV